MGKRLWDVRCLLTRTPGLDTEHHTIRRSVMKRIFGFVAALCLLGPSGALADSSITVLTRNLYVGTDLDAVLAASRSELPSAVATAFDIFEHTDFNARMAAVADEIASMDPLPDLIGLQEVTLLLRQSPGDSLNLPPVPPPTPAMDPVADFLTTLLDELAARGLIYTPVAEVQNFDVEIPKANDDGSYDDLRLIDRDVILARGEGSNTANDDSGTYAAALHFQTVTITRGWVAVDATINGTTVRFVSTHLEDADAGLRYAQSLELIRMLAREKRPIILVGDFNNETDDDFAYQALLAAGYTDHVGPGADNTCCQDAELKFVSPFTERDDIIFTRNTGATGVSTLIGHTPFQLSQPRWASDHAGVWAHLDF